MSYYVFQELKQRPDRDNEKSYIASIKKFPTRGDAIGFAKRRCRQTKALYHVVSESALVTMGPQVIEMSP